MQIEEAYIGADQFCSLVRQDSQSVLRNELNVLHGLKFDLITHPPLRALDGFFQVRSPTALHCSLHRSIALICICHDVVTCSVLRYRHWLAVIVSKCKAGVLRTEKVCTTAHKPCSLFLLAPDKLHKHNAEP